MTLFVWTKLVPTTPFVHKTLFVQRTWKSTSVEYFNTVIDTIFQTDRLPFWIGPVCVRVSPHTVCWKWFYMDISLSSGVILSLGRRSKLLNQNEQKKSHNDSFKLYKWCSILKAGISIKYSMLTSNVCISFVWLCSQREVGWLNKTDCSL